MESPAVARQAAISALAESRTIAGSTLENVIAGAVAGSALLHLPRIGAAVIEDVAAATAAAKAEHPK